MAKSDKNIVRDILRAQGLWNVEPTDEAVKILRDTKHASYREGSDAAEYDHQQNEGC